MYPAKPIARWIPAILCLAALTGACAGRSQRTEDYALGSGFQGEIAQGAPFQHQLYSRWRRDDALFVFIEGDGLPWIHGGQTPSDDPTPKTALALKLAARTQGSVLYLGRPCHFAARLDRRCETLVWTDERYAEETVASMTFVLRQEIAAHAVRHVTLVGYSGGATLALLIAPRIAQLERLISVAGNLDIAAWTAGHGYEPLHGLDPVREPPLEPRIEQYYLIGDKDESVRPEWEAAFLARVPAASVWHFPKFDHRCCWVQAWPDILARIRTTNPAP